ncbi:hypothetical protein [Sphingomonas sp. CCH9-E2]|uniref:hypothetical protein n=1 Tax=Sphingomonas sp. CCH9-E2 TaxID=1768776 RepID=UPI0008360CB4|nr:hypothetical protein [Sphingomonas sp. CCH9-E2]
MEKMILDRKRFIGGRLAQEGEEIDLDEKGGFMPAGSTPVDQMTTEQLEAILAKRKKEEGKAAKPQLDHDSDGKAGGSKPRAAAGAKAAKATGGKTPAPAPTPPVKPSEGDELSLDGKDRAALIEVAGREGVEFAEDATDDEIRSAIIAKRDDA